MSQFFWLYIEPYVHMAKEQNDVLLYNPLNGKLLQFKKFEKIANLIQRLLSRKNLRVIRVSGNDLLDPAISSFLKQIRASYFGDIVDTSCFRGKPLQISPILSVQSDIHRKSKATAFAFGIQSMQSLEECTIYITNQSNQNSPLFEKAYRQFLFPFNENKKKELDYHALINLLNQLLVCPSCRLNIIGGNILNYSNFENLFDFLYDIPATKSFYFCSADIFGNEATIKAYFRKKVSTSNGPKNIQFKFFVEPSSSKKEFSNLLDFSMEIPVGSTFIFVLRNKEQLAMSEALIEEFKITNFTYKPYFDGQNRSFFNKHVFIKKSDIVNSKVTQKDILAKSKINPSEFGKLIVFNNGDIFANPNQPRLGNIRKNSIASVINKELYHGKSWRSLRGNVEPCKNCVFCLLCPPLSHYESIMKKNALCHIRKNKYIKYKE